MSPGLHLDQPLVTYSYLIGPSQKIMESWNVSVVVDKALEQRG